MIVALVVIQETTPHVQSAVPCFLTLDSETILERMVRTILRGPFGGTIIAAHADLADAVREQVQGFAVQVISVQPASSGTHSFFREGLAAAAVLRERWEKAMAAAASRFPGATSKAGKKSSNKQESPKQAFSTHRSSKDLKVRGLARSFDRDGVMLFRDTYPAMSLELQAQMVESFGREGADKGNTARPIAQAVYQGRRGYPIIMDVNAANEVEHLPLETDFDAWLLQQAQRIQDVTTDEWGASAALRTEEDYVEICRRLKPLEA